MNYFVKIIIIYILIIHKYDQSSMMRDHHAFIASHSEEREAPTTVIVVSHWEIFGLTNP